MNNLIKLYGGPGCGKTTKLLQILDTLLQDTAPERIAYVSFTNKGTDAGVFRARRKHKLNKEDTPYWDTIHAICNREACKNSGSIISTDNYRWFSLATQMRFLGYFTEELNHGDDLYLFMEQLRRTNSAKHERMLASLPDHNKYEWVISQYRKFKKIYGIYDFTDMLNIYLAKNEPLDIDYMIVDEAQDLTPLQWQVIEVMSKNCIRVYVAGDDDQAIYEWCGGDVGIFNTLPANEEIILDVSYRLNDRILYLTQELARTIKGHKEKRIKSANRGFGNITAHKTIETVPLNKEHSYYFLARNRCFLTSIRNWLFKFSFPFTMRGLIYPRKISGANKHRIDRLEYNYSLHMQDTGYTRSFLDRKITVDTIHRVKGGEADVVVLLLDCTRAVKENLINNIDEELRVLYVALTRAKKHLHIVYSDSDINYDAIIARALAA